MLPERARALVLPAYQSSLVHFHGRRLWRVESTNNTLASNTPGLWANPPPHCTPLCSDYKSVIFALVPLVYPFLLLLFYTEVTQVLSSYSHRFGCNSRALLITNPPNRRKYSENPGPGHDCVDPHAQRALPKRQSLPSTPALGVTPTGGNPAAQFRGQDLPPLAGK